jgi:hypothetical protein
MSKKSVSHEVVADIIFIADSQFSTLELSTKLKLCVSGI